MSAYFPSAGALLISTLVMGCVSSKAPNPKLPAPSCSGVVTNALIFIFLVTVIFFSLYRLGWRQN